MSRQELDVPQIPWIRLGANEADVAPHPATAPDIGAERPFGNQPVKDQPVPNQSVKRQPTTQHSVRSRPSQHGSDRRETIDTLSSKQSSVPNTPPTSKPRTDSATPSAPASSASASRKHGQDATVSSSVARKPQRDASVGEDAFVAESVPQQRNDSGRSTGTAQPKYLKHAVRFGGPVSPQSGDRLAHEQQRKNSEREVQDFQSRHAESVQPDDIATLRGVDHRGNVYTGTAPGEVASELEQFLKEHHRAVEQLPVIETTTNRKVQPAPPPEESKALPNETIPVDDRANPYWIQALIQIVLGTLIAITLMHLAQALRSQDSNQLIQTPASQGADYPVKQATTAEPVSVRIR